MAYIIGGNARLYMNGIDMGPTWRLVHQDGIDALVCIRNMVFLVLRDSTTGVSHLLRVPPGMERARQALAWTFGLEEEKYAPEVET